MLLRLAADEDVVVKSTAIGVMGQCAHFDAKVCEVLRQQLEHQDAHVRSAALLSLKDLELEHDKDALFDAVSTCLDDPASNMVHGALKCLESLLDGREAVICELASPLIDHGDATVREAAVALLGSLPELQHVLDSMSREPELCCSQQNLAIRLKLSFVTRGPRQDDQRREAGSFECAEGCRRPEL